MFEKFTEKAIKTIMLAQEESRILGHNYVGTEQILLGIISEDTNVASSVLNKYGVSLKKARAAVRSIIGKGSGFVAIEIPFTPKAKRSLECALENAKKLKNDYIAPEHLLLGLLDVKDCVAINILELCSVDVACLRVEIMNLISKSKTLPQVVKSPVHTYTHNEDKENDIERRLKSIEEQMQAFQTNKNIPKPQKHCVFIGHGRNKIWARVNSFLRDEMLIQTEYFERNSQTGKSVITALESCLEKSTFAVVIMTAEDETSGGEQRARQNVIHEIGLFQGKLGFEKVAILLQEGVEQFSNIAGLQYIPFVRDNIEQTFYELEKMLIREGIIAKRVTLPHQDDKD